MVVNIVYRQCLGSSKLLTVEIADRLLIARLSLNPSDLSSSEPFVGASQAQLRNESAFEYLTKSWIRALEERSKALASKSSPSDKVRLIEKVKELLVSYIGLVTVEPSMFPTSENANSGTDELVKLFSNPAPSDPMIQHKWTLIHELANRFDNDGLEDVIGSTLVRIAMDVNLLTSKWHIGGHEWRVPVRTVEDLMEVKPIARMVLNLPAWMPIANSNDNGRRIEFFWIFGPILSLSTFPDRVVMSLSYVCNSL
jgi:ubiquitin conjugation factor E4 B